jgi:alpha-D-ribose 1-methylphosphonate 5-phosphate C-P lyase
MDYMPALQIFGAGREKRIYAVPPFTRVKSLDFEDFPFEAERSTGSCELCGSTESYLDEIIIDDRGGRLFVCSDTDYCSSRIAEGHKGVQPRDLQAEPAPGEEEVRKCA